MQEGPSAGDSGVREAMQASTADPLNHSHCLLTMHPLQWPPLPPPFQAEYSRVLGAELRRRLADGGANVDDVAAVQAAVDSLPPPPRAAAALEVGQALGAAGRHAEALTSFRAAAAAAPRDPLAHFRAGNACFALAHYVAAATEYRAALSLCAAAGEAERPLAVKVHVNLGITLEASGLLMAACEEYK